MSNMFPCLWFKTEAEEAMNYYASVFKNTKIEHIARNTGSGPNPEGSVMVVTGTLDGQKVMALNGNPKFPFTMAMSLVTSCDTQEELDEKWDKLSAGGKVIQCGWLEDKFGISWQVVPSILPKLIGGDQEHTKRVMAAVVQMIKLDIATLQRAYDGN